MRDRLIRLAAFKLLLDEIGAAQAREKVDLMQEVGGRLGGAAAVVDGHEIGTVSIVQGRAEKGSVAGWVIYDVAAWTAWVKSYRPSAIVEVVRESDAKSILSNMGEILEEREGELPPGIAEAEHGNDYVVVNQTPEQRANAIRAWRAGALQMPGMEPQIEEGGDG